MDNLNEVLVRPQVIGHERQVGIALEALDGNTFLPKPVKYDDMDSAFKEWADSLSIVTPEGMEFPTMKLFSNQRFSEYTQSWKYTDDNKNLLLNFKTITRENNPYNGTIRGNIWNIPGERYFLIDERKVLDDNGSESLLRMSMKQPRTVDLIYSLSVFTNLYEKINEFNTKVLTLFSARQSYLKVNGHYMPMVLDNVSDESSYSLDDRQFYSQTYSIKLSGYIITEDSMKVSEIPIKKRVMTGFDRVKKKTPDIEIEECDGAIKKDGYEYEPMKIDVSFGLCPAKVKFEMDCDMTVTDVEMDNLSKNVRFYVNDNEAVIPFTAKEYDVLEVVCKKRNPMKESMLSIIGYDPNNARKIDQ